MTLACVQPQLQPAAIGDSIFAAPYDALSAGDMLRDHRGRLPLRYFPVVDAGETRRDKIDRVLDNEFDFNGETHRMGDPVAWLDNPSDDLEWQILLHKFYYATGLGLAYGETGAERYLNKWIALTGSWIDRVQPDFLAGTSVLNGDEFAAVTGRRIQNWIYAHYYFVSCGAADLPAGFYRRFVASLHDQVEHLAAHLAPARNHRTIELYAIFLAGVVFPEMKPAARWRDFALEAIVENMRTDLLPDGVQCELSTDYHHLVLRNYLCVRRLAELNRIAVPGDMDVLIRRALDFSLHVHKPDGLVPSLSDGDVRSFLPLLDQGYQLYGCPEYRYVATRGRSGSPPACRSKAFRDSGYYVLRSGWGEGGESFADERYLIFDCGPLGAGNHGHLDLLNIEIAAYGRSLVVDPGRYTYSESGDVNWRVRFRGTASHNTVVVDGRNQTRYVPGKRKFKIKGPAPRHALRAFVSRPDHDYLHGVARSHEYDAVHERRILFSAGEYWIVADHLFAAREHSYDLLFHLSPEAEGRAGLRREDGTCAVVSPNLVLAQSAADDTDVAIDPGFVSQRYGEKRAVPVVRFSRRRRNTAFHTVVYPYRGEAPAIAMRDIPVMAEGEYGATAHAHAFAVTIDRGGVRTTDYCFFAPDTPGAVWCFEGFRFSGRYLFLRESPDGAVTRLHASAGAVLERDGTAVAFTETAA